MLHGVCLKLKPVGKPDAVAPHVRFDERGRETGLYATALVLDSTGHVKFWVGGDYLGENNISHEYCGLRCIEIIPIFAKLKISKCLMSSQP